MFTSQLTPQNNDNIIKYLNENMIEIIWSYNNNNVYFIYNISDGLWKLFYVRHGNSTRDSQHS